MTLQLKYQRSHDYKCKRKFKSTPAPVPPLYQYTGTHLRVAALAL